MRRKSSLKSFARELRAFDSAGRSSALRATATEVTRVAGVVDRVVAINQAMGGVEVIVILVVEANGQNGTKETREGVDA